MEQSFQSFHDDTLEFFVIDTAGQEKPYSCYTLRVRTHRTGTEEPVDVSLTLTVPQLAQIVKHFFWEITVRHGWAVNFLQRLLVKRWAVMTDQTCKNMADQRHKFTSQLATDFKKYTELDFTFKDGKRVMREK